MKELDLKTTILDVIAVNTPNGLTVAVITLTEIKDFLAILLAVVSIISTLIIIRNNTRKRKD